MSRVGEREGGGVGFQSDRPTERSDNERSGLSGVQAPSRHEMAARERGRMEKGCRGERKKGKKVPSQLGDA